MSNSWQSAIKKFWAKDIYFILFIFFFSLLFRVIYIFTIDHLPLFDNPTMDAGFHDTWAKQLASGDFVGYGPYIRAPLYPHLLGLLYWIFGANYYIIRFFFAILGSISVVLIFKLTKYLFCKQSAILASFIAALSWTFIYYDAELLITSTALFINLLCVFFFAKTFKSPTKKNYFLCGLLFGIGAITRTNLIPIIAIIFIWIIFYYRKDFKKAAIFAALFLSGAILAISPVTIRNAVVVKDFIPVSYYTGVNLYIGNNPYADGRTAIVPGTRADWWGGVEDIRIIAEAEEGRKLKPSEISLFWSRRAYEYIRGDFFGFIMRTLKKFLFIFDLNETSNNKNINFFRNQSRLLKIPVLFSGWFYIPLGFLGMFFAAREKRRNVLSIFIFLIAYCTPLSLFFVYTRLRQPIMGFFIIFTGFALMKLYRAWFIDKRYLINGLILYLILFIGLFINSSKDTRFKDGYFTLANAYMRKSDFKNAELFFNKSLGLGEPYSSRIFFQLGNIKFQQGEYETAAEYLKQVLKNNYKLTGQTDEFLTDSLFVSRLSPVRLINPEDKLKFERFAQVFSLIGQRYVRWGAYDEAELAFRKTLFLKETPAANLNLGNILSRVGSMEHLEYYYRAIELDAQFLPAYINLSDDLRKYNKFKEALSLLRKAAKFTRNQKESAIIESRISKLERLIKNER